jgi:hypothetical protein
MSGGAALAADGLSPDEFAAAAETSRYFGLNELAELLQLIATSTPDDDEHLQTAYDAVDRDGIRRSGSLFEVHPRTSNLYELRQAARTLPSAKW